MSPALIGRPPLVERAADVVKSRLTLLVAPPGSGKSVLLDQWTERLQGTADVVRLDLGFEHNDPVRFQTDILAASGALFDSMPADTGEILPSTVPDFVAGIAARGVQRPLVFMFDRHEHITDPIITDTILSALQLLPPETTVVFSSRVAPNILFSDYRSRGELLQLGFPELKLQPGEYGELAALLASSATAAEIDQIARETLGWMAAARRLLQHDARGLTEYIDSDVLAGFSVRARELAAEAAMAETMTATQAEALFGLNRDGHLSEAAELWGVQLPMVQDAGGSAWRFPPVLRQALRDDLERRDPARFGELLSRASAVTEGAPALSPVEQEVLLLLAAGSTAAGAARSLGLTFHLVKAHIRSLYEKLGVSTRASALHRADALGLLGDGEPTAVASAAAESARGSAR